MSDFVLTYDVPGVPDLQVGVNDTGQVSLVIGLESATLFDSARIAAVQLVLEQARVDQDRIHRERFPAPEVRPDMLSDALEAYRAQASGSYESPRHRPAMVAALTAANIYEPEVLDIALRAFRRGQHGAVSTTERMRRALQAVLEEVTP